MKPIRFKFAAAKARAAIEMMVAARPGVDLHTMLKSCYFADRQHLNQYGRPIFGATYRAMKFGPVPIEIYEMAKGEALWLAELDAERYPWRIDGFRLYRTENTDPDLGALSETDVDALKKCFDRSRAMTFSARTAATHGPDWQAANLGFMRYEDMIDESPEKEKIVEYLREAAPFIRL